MRYMYREWWVPCMCAGMRLFQRRGCIDDDIHNTASALGFVGIVDHLECIPVVIDCCWRPVHRLSGIKVLAMNGSGSAFNHRVAMCLECSKPVTPWNFQ